MSGFKLILPNQDPIHFRYYDVDAPITSQAFNALLPFEVTLKHARVSGQEIWTDNAPPLDIIQENASVFTQPGEVVYGPSKPERVSTKNCMGIYYGQGKGVDACNIFACVIPEDAEQLQKLGDMIWRKGEHVMRFEKWTDEN